MLYISDREVAAVLDPKKAADAIEQAFLDWARDEAAIQPRVRTVTPAGKLSTLGAVLTREGLAGAKVYPTSPEGRFGFVVLLFDLPSGEALAVMDGGVLTEIRTAATSVVVARHLAPPQSKVLTVFGSGRQALAHARAFATEFALAEMRFVTRRKELGEGLPKDVNVVVVSDPAEALPGSTLIVTATRSRSPLFASRDLPGGCHVTALGATTSDSRELDSKSIERADLIVVESIEQARIEAGELLIAESEGAAVWSRVVEIADLVVGKSSRRSGGDQITLYKSLGIGLEDVAVAAAIHREAVTRRIGTPLSSKDRLWAD